MIVFTMVTSRDVLACWMLLLEELEWDTTSIFCILYFDSIHRYLHLLDQCVTARSVLHKRSQFAQSVKTPNLSVHRLCTLSAELYFGLYSNDCTYLLAGVPSNAISPLQIIQNAVAWFRSFRSSRRSSWGSPPASNSHVNSSNSCKTPQHYRPILVQI